HDSPERVSPEATRAAGGGGARQADLRPEVEHDPPDAGLPDLPLLRRRRSPRGRFARAGRGHRAGDPGRQTGRAVTAERLYPAAPAPDGGTGQPGVAIARTGALPARSPLPGPGSR